MNGESSSSGDGEGEGEGEGDASWMQLESTPMKRQRRARTCFTVEALERLEKMFLHNPYPDINQREQLSTELGIPESRIQVWYQNKRSRTRRRAKKRSSKVLSPIADGDSDSASHNHKIRKQEDEKTVAKYTAFTVDRILALQTQERANGAEQLVYTVDSRSLVAPSAYQYQSSAVVAALQKEDYDRQINWLQQLYKTWTLHITAPLTIAVPIENL